MSAVSEAQAREGWCPFSRVFASLHGDEAAAVGSFNRMDPMPPQANCMGAGCMAWRWAGWWRDGIGAIAATPRTDGQDGPRLGYCGLAGKPWGSP